MSNVDKKTADGEQPVRLVNYTDVYYGDRLSPSLDLMEATASMRQIRSFRLRPGDVVITKDSELANDIGVPAYVEAVSDDMVLGYHLALLRPRPEVVDGSYLYWAMCSDHARGQLSTGATGVTRFGLRREVIASTALSAPNLAMQRAIADFLNTETARIDALMAKKRRLMVLLKAKLTRERTRVIWSRQQPTTRLKYLTHPDRPIMYGIVLPGPDVGDGVSIVKGGDVAAGLRRPLAKTTREIEARYARSRLRLDDCLFAIRGGVGDVALVPEAVVGANITQDVARVAPGESIEPRWLFHALRTDEVQSQAALRTTGATIHGLNIWELQQIQVPEVDAESQQRQVRELDEIEVCVGTATTKLESQCSLLKEHRQALITAAVAGHLTIPEVAA